MATLSSKGQESAPFELFIAVIIMTFVMMFGYNALSEMEKKRCQATIDQELQRMRTAIEGVTNQGSLEKITFEVPACFKNSKVKLSAVLNRAICSSICQEGRAECVSLDYWSDDYYERVCVNIPLSTQFEGTSSGGPGTYCPDRRPDYTLVPFRDEDVGVPNGSYLLMNRTPPGWSREIICAYKME